MSPVLDARAQRLLPACLATFMSAFVAAVVTAINTGIDGAFLLRWLRAWSVAWPAAVIAAYAFRPLAARCAAVLARWSRPRGEGARERR
ncbi:DUF2798 domain-containing protein [Lysobacter korlensis]|uniref:DUF2798 domain-containing protein n=1 Tax=Lysobacter korlensis TaxID=553636 RepID=A0ABV6RJM8_9GAMM